MSTTFQRATTLCVISLVAIVVAGLIVIRVHAQTASTTTAGTIPAAPSGISVFVSGSKVSVLWTDKSNNETRFEIYSRFGADPNQPASGAWATIGQTGSNGTSFTDFGVSGTYSYTGAYVYPGFYEYRVGACNAAGCALSSDTVTFTPFNTPPVISGVTASNVTQTGASIFYTTNQEASMQVEYGTSLSYGQSTAIFASRLTTHSASLSGLQAGVTYHYRVISVAATGMVATSGDYTFTTLAAPSSALVPGAGAPEPSSISEPGVWAQVDIATGQIGNTAVCTRAVCGLNGEYHGYVPPGSYATGAVWWPTSKRYIWQVSGQAGYNSGTFSFSTYVFTVPGGTIYNGQFTPTVAPQTPTPTPSSTSTSPTPTPTPTFSSSPSPSPFPSPSLSNGDPSLVGHWKFDGNGNNEVVGKPSAVAVGDAVFHASGGKLGGYLYVLGSADWAKIPYVAAYDLQSFTVAFWFRQRADRSFLQDLVYKGNGLNNYNFRIFRQLWNQYNFGAIITGYTAATTGYWSQTSNPNQLAHNVWHHVAYTKDAAGSSYYLDGVLTHHLDVTQYTEYSGLPKMPALDIIIGNSAVDTDIDDLKIYSRALSASEVAQHGGFSYSLPTPTPTFSPSPSPAPSPSLLPAIPALPGTPTSTPAVPAIPAVPSVCQNGSVLLPNNQCASRTTPIGECLANGKNWCYTDPANSLAGYCAPGGSACAVPQPTPVGPITVPGPITPPPSTTPRFGTDEFKTMAAERLGLLRDVRELERLARRREVKVNVKELSALKDQLLSLRSPEDIGAFQEKVGQLYGDAAERTVREDPAEIEDPRAQAQALRQMKQGVRFFEQYLRTIETRVSQVEKSGIAIPADIKETIDTAKTMAKRVKTAKTFDDVADIQDQMPEIGLALNDILPRLEDLSRLPKVLKLVDRRVSEADRAIKQTIATAKRLKLDVSDHVAAMQTILAEAKTAIASVKSGTAEGRDILSTLQDSVLDKTDEILQTAEHVKTVANIRASVTRVAAEAKRYETTIRRQEAKGENRQDAYALLDQFKENVTGLKDAASQKLTPEAGDQIIEYLHTLQEVREQLDEALGIALPSALENQIKRLFEVKTETIQPFDVGRLGV